MKIFITSQDSLLGAELNNSLSDGFICTGSTGDIFTSTQNDLLFMLERENPDIIIHNCEVSSLRFCEENPRKSFKINSLLTKKVAKAADRLDSLMVYFSSFQVFSGKKGNAYYEFDRPDPANVYGWSKWWGEHYVSSLSNNNYLVLRLPLLFGLKGNEEDNLLLSKTFSHFNHYVDPLFEYITNPTWATHVSNIVLDLLCAREWGTYHVGNTGTADVKQFMKAVIEEKGFSNANYYLDILSGNYHRDYRYKVLQSAYLPFHSVVRDLPNWRDALKECLKMLPHYKRY